MLVRVSHPIFHQAVDSTPAPLRPPGAGMHLRRSSSGTMDGAQQQQEGKLGSLQVHVQSESQSHAPPCQNSHFQLDCQHEPSFMLALAEEAFRAALQLAKLALCRSSSSMTATQAKSGPRGSLWQMCTASAFWMSASSTPTATQVGSFGVIWRQGWFILSHT